MTGLFETKRQASRILLAARRVSLLIAALLAIFTQRVQADDGPENLHVASQPRWQFAIEDFDGDNRPDLASVEVGQSSAGVQSYQIRFQLTTGLPQSIRLAAPAGGLQLRSRDVNGDSYPDVVVTTFWTDRPVAVLLNDGRGNFTQSEPSRFPTAFPPSERPLVRENGAAGDVGAALFQRYVPGRCEECARALSPLLVAGRSSAEGFKFESSSGRDSFFGRAPPPSLLRH